MTWQDVAAMPRAGEGQRYTMMTLMLLQPVALNEGRAKWHPALFFGHHPITAWEITFPNQKLAKAFAAQQKAEIVERVDAALEKASA